MATLYTFVLLTPKSTPPANKREGVYVVQLDTQCSFMVEFIHYIYQLNSVSDLTGSPSGASFELYERIGMW
jgi:hypothetical protein